MTDTRDDLTTRAASYAVSALTPAERREVEADLRRDRRLAAEVREFTATAALLGLAADPVAPSAGLRSSILDALDEVPQDSRVVRGPWLTRPLTALVGAAAAVVLAVAGTALALSLIPNETSAVDRIVAAADYSSATAEVDGGGTVKAIWSGELAQAAVLVSDLDALSGDRVYQLWFIDDAGAASAGTFTPTGEDPQSIVLEGAMDAGDAIGITIEPAGGSTTPTTTPIVVIATA